MINILILRIFKFSLGNKKMKDLQFLFLYA